MNHSWKPEIFVGPQETFQCINCNMWKLVDSYGTLYYSKDTYGSYIGQKETSCAEYIMQTIME